MPDNTGLIVIAVIVGGGVIATLAYYLERFMRGTLRLALSSTAFSPGDSIAGSFELNTKKTLQGNRLIVSLIGVEVTQSYHNGKRRTHSHEIYRDEVLLEKAKEYPAGFTATYSFAIPTPKMPTPDVMDSPVGQALTTALRLLGNRSTHLKWKVEARLDAKGVDLATAQSVSINIDTTKMIA